MEPPSEPSIEDLVRQVIDTALADTRLGRAAFGLSPESEAVPSDITLDDNLYALVAASGALMEVVRGLGAEIDELRARVTAIESN